jgi:hypothetical protein
MTAMWIKIKSMVEKKNQIKKKKQDISSSPLVRLLPFIPSSLLKQLSNSW